MQWCAGYDGGAVTDSGKILPAVVSLLIAILAIRLAPLTFDLFRRINGWWQQSLILEYVRRLARTSKWTLTPAEWEACRLIFLLAAIFLCLNFVFWGAITSVVYVGVEWRFSILAPLLLQLRHASMVVKEIVAFIYLLSCLMSFLSLFSLSLLERWYQELQLHTDLGRKELKKELNQLRRKQRAARLRSQFS